MGQVMTPANQLTVTFLLSVLLFISCHKDVDEQ